MNAIILFGLYLGGMAISAVVLCVFIGWIANMFSELLGLALGILLIIPFLLICFGLLWNIV
jgi:hypothetical protein